MASGFRPPGDRYSQLTAIEDGQVYMLHCKAYAPVSLAAWTRALHLHTQPHPIENL